MKILRFLAAWFVLTLPAAAQLVDYRGLGTNGFYTNGFIVNSKYWTNQSGAYRYQPGTGPVNTGGAPGPAFTIRKDGSLFVGTNVTQDINLADYTTLYLPWAITMTKSNEPVTLRSIYTVADDESYGFYSSGGLNLSGNKDAGSSQLFVTSHLTNGANTATYLISDPSASPPLLFKGETNGVNIIQTRSDGSMFVGKNVDIDVSLSSFAAVRFPHAISFTRSNQAPVLGTWGTIDSEDYNNYGYLIFSTATNGTVLTVKSEDGTGERDVILRSAVGADAFALRSSGNPLFTIGPDGDLDLIKSISYSWPTTNGGASQILTTDGGSPQQLYWSTPSSGGITNSGVGPGTNNYIAKFVNPTNVQNSPISSSVSNVIKYFLPPDGGTHTNSGTNLWYGEFTNAGTNQWVELVVPKGHNNEAAFLRTMAIGQTGQRATLTLNDSLNIEPITNQYAGHGANGLIYPDNDGITPLGSTSKRFHGVNSDAFGFVATPSSAGAQFGNGVSGAGMGLTTDGAMVQFFRDTGITAAFNKTYGLFMFDVAGNYIGFGTGISNCISFLSTSTLAGLVQVGTNSAVAAPAAAGIMGAQGSGTDKSGSDLRIVGGPSTGVGTNGSVRIQTSEPALSTSSSLNNNFYDRLYVCAKPKVLTTNSATIVFNVTIPTADRMIGGEVTATTKISDGVDQASVRERFAFTAIRKGSTVTTAISASAPMATLATGSAVLTTTWTAVANAQSVDIKCNAVTSGILSTNTFTRWSVELDSDAVPVISP